ncbi:DUF4405 domain-containing protein [Lutibacter sp. TH_r2]|uniref:DUF4405 domain-containing protein n=1 Tax=Lutibacter sp. TH_r2 TaxID=3082083 RepID=UPI002952A2FC|nr:DUF4405 domain-containing protein [Lutibacter sp. TH_r2]MDV7186214.1 DUF4405 domain-containing protein [Lutibacter sp. TH_r2]
MFRKAVSITLLVSLMALASSGIMMIVLNSLEFQLQMHPVHKIFGILMTISGCFHIYFNFKPIKKYLSIRKVLAFGIGMVLIMSVLYVVGFNKPLDKEKIQEIELLMSQLESKS